MSFNGSGTFLINSTGQPVVANTVISATVFNALTADLASGLTNCITKDGQSTPTANIPMGSNKITGLAVGTLINDAATLGQVQSTAAKLIGSISGVDTVLGIMSPTLTAYAAGQLFYYIAAGANTGAVTLNIDGLGAKAVTRDGSTALAAGDINSGEIVVVIYDGTRFQMINAANSFGNTTINGTLTVTGNTGLQANVSITSTLSVGGTFAVTGAATLGSTLVVTGKADLPTVSTASINAAVAVVTTGTVTNLTSTSASIASVNAGVALLTTATVTDLTASSASIASANIGNLQFTAASIASINAGVAVVTNLTATSASIASANVGTAVITTGTVTNLTSTSASIASANAAVALVTTGTVTNLTSTSASIASANLGTAVVTTGTVTNLTATSASIASANAGTAVVTNLTATGASIASANVGTGVVTTLTATQASVGSINAAVALVTNGTVTTLSGTQASITSANHAVLRLLGSVSGYVGLQGAAAAGSTTYTLPSADGSSGQVLSTNGSGTLSWATGGGGGTGDVVGPASATDNAITRFDLTTGKLIQNSTVILDDAGTITGVAALAAVTVSVTSANAGTATITSGNLTFSSTGQRITGDFSNATVASRLLFQNSTTDAVTRVGAIPNGTATESGYNFYNTSAVTTGEFGQLFITTSEVSLRSAILPSGSFLPMTFYTGGSERMRLDTSGNVGIGTASPTTGYKLSVSAATASNTVTGGINIQSNRSYSTSNNGVIFSAIANNGTLGTHDFGALIFQEAPTSNGASAYVRMFAGGASTTGAAANKFLEGYFDGSLLNYVAAFTNGSERMRIDSSGNVGIGGTANAFDRVTVTGTLPTSGNTSIGIGSRGTIPSGTTSQAASYSSVPATQAASFTLGELVHYWALQGTFGAGSTVTNQFGFRVDSSLTGATNNFGFHSNIASGSNRYNFYAAGTAQNYFAGVTAIGRAPTDTIRLFVQGSTTGANDYSLVCYNSAEQDLFYVRNDGLIKTGAGASSPYNNTTGSAANMFVDSSGLLYRSTSSLRYKSDVTDAAHGLADVLKLRSVTYKGINDGDKVFGGLIAEEVHDAGLTEFVAYDKEGRPDALHYGNMVALLVKAVQELSAKVAALEAK